MSDLEIKEFWKTAVTNYSYNLGAMPIKYKTYEICLIAVMSDGLLLKYVPLELRDYDMCNAAIQSRIDTLKYVPVNLILHLLINNPNLMITAVYYYLNLNLLN